MSNGFLYFFALVPEGALLEELTVLKKSLAKEYQSFAALKAPPHITIAAPRYLKSEELDEFIEHCRARIMGIKPFEICLRDYGFFELRTFYIAVESNTKLKSLYLKLRTEEKSNEPGLFTPHLTLLNRDVAEDDMRKLLLNYESQSYERAFMATGVHVFKYSHRKKRWINCDFMEFSK